MQDVSGGKERVRIWPRSRGKPKTKAEKQRQDHFRAVQLAAKYVSPQQMLDVMNARAGTPILPRDVFTSMWANRLISVTMPNGRTLYPMPARLDVEQALDTITQTTGQTLRKTATGWEGADPSSSGLLGAIVERPAVFTAPLANTNYAIPFTDELIDQASIWDLAQPTKLIAPAPGWTMFAITLVAQASSGDLRVYHLVQNGEVIAGLSFRNANVGSTNRIALNGIAYAQAGDEFELLVQANVSNRQYSSVRASIIFAG